MRKWFIALMAMLGTLPFTLNAKTISVQSVQGIETLPVKPSRIAVFDLGALDTVSVLGGEVVALPKATALPPYLTKFNDEHYLDVGSLKEPNFEKLNEAEPDLNIISARQARLEARFDEIAPTYFSGIDMQNFYPSFQQNVRNIAAILDQKPLAESKLLLLDKQMQAIKQKTKSKTALLLLVNESKLSTYGQDSRFGLLFQGYGFTPVDNDIKAATHGMSVSFEYVLAHNPDYIFVIDRTAAITEKKDNAKKVLDNDIIRRTQAYQHGRIVYLDPANWYLAMGGLQAMQMMNDEIEAALK
ncbi:siderophore ABC transporter substrate-binding protein [Spirabiliibacterium falconis]|uniref:siderophore ABC transporter substrate-binding protein n=1 Tax=Spirabiliibacterium falconis TaxID=572023 RepID=UPI001AACC549|nr:siderophore ABC transporter substrate-binding protein [Spirabiliibacterium falconis]MBE2893583.1 siderophore ABC transporter substrate-binding protein [Spirabiliibacterium falconis]